MTCTRNIPCRFASVLLNSKEKRKTKKRTKKKNIVKLRGKQSRIERTGLMERGNTENPLPPGKYDRKIGMKAETEKEKKEKKKKKKKLGQKKEEKN